MTSQSGQALLNQKGQALLIILLATLVALTIGLTITQRSLTEVSNSSRVEQSSRAFSAAEAGIEDALSKATPTDGSLSDLGNSSGYGVTTSGEVPKNTDHLVGLEYPPITKSSFAHYWLADPNQVFIGPNYGATYTHSNFLLYFGNSNADTDTPKPAVEVNVVTYNTATSKYLSNKYYLDSDGTRADANKFTKVSVLTDGSNCSGGNIAASVYSTSNANPLVPNPSSPFYCKVTIPPECSGGGNCAAYTGANIIPILVRVRVLYSNNSQRIAITPALLGYGSAPPDYDYFPPQAVLYDATGTAGDSKRKLRLFTLKNVVPFYFDYAIFSSGTISKE